MGPLVTMSKGRSYCSALITPSICHLCFTTFVCLSHNLSALLITVLSGRDLQRALTKDYEMICSRTRIRFYHLTAGKQIALQRSGNTPSIYAST